MNEFTCGKCLFHEEIGSSDVALCTASGELKKVNEPACGKFTKGSLYEAKAQRKKIPTFIPIINPPFADNLLGRLSKYKKAVFDFFSGHAFASFNKEER